MCDYLYSTPISRNLANTNNGGTNALMRIIRDGRNIQDNYSHASHSPGFALFPAFLQRQQSPRRGASHADASTGVGQVQGHSEVTNNNNHQVELNEVEPDINGSADETEIDTEVTINIHKRHDNNSLSHTNADIGLSQRLSQTVAQEHDYNKDSSLLNENHQESHDGPTRSKVRRTTESGSDHNTFPSPRRRSRHGSSFSDGLSDENSAPVHITGETSGLSHPQTRKPRGRGAQKKPKLKIGCRCGLATPTPGKLTCCGQRCPCYSSFKGCIPDCRCRGCRNPRKVPIEYVHTVTKADTTNTDSDDSEIEIDV